MDLQVNNICRISMFSRSLIFGENLAQSWFAVRNSKKKFMTVTDLWNRDPLKILNGIKLILDDQGNHLDSYTISLESFRSFRVPLFRKPGQELFFAVSYSKPALTKEFMYFESLTLFHLCVWKKIEFFVIKGSDFFCVKY